MLGSDTLEIAIGLIFVYLVLSLICSAINELIEGLLNARAANLERGLRELLADPAGTGLVKAIYEHPLIHGLFKGTYDPAKTKKGMWTRRKLPSYLPPRNFALALMDAVLPATPMTASGASSSLAAAAIPPSPAGGPPVVAALRTAIGGLPNTDVQRALLTLLDAAGGDIGRVRQNIEAWYNSAMDRVAGRYKRRTQFILLGLGMVVAIGMNADTITIARSLSVDKSLRNALVSAARQYAAQPVGHGLPAPECTADKKESPECESLPVACQRDGTSPECRVQLDLEQLRTLGLPIGWSTALDDPRSIHVAPWWWLVRVVGWFLTACAISLGAPLWFDLLNKISVVRSTVKPQEKSPEEPSKG